MSPDVPLSRRWTMPGRRGPPTPAISGACASAAAARVPVDRPAPGCVTIPAGLSTTRTWASSKTMVRGMASAAISSGVGDGTTTSTLSPAFSRCAALLAAPLGGGGARGGPGGGPPGGGGAAPPRPRRPRPRRAGRPRPSYPRRRGRQHAQREERHAHADGRIGDVEGGPVPAAPVEVEEVHHGPEARAVDQVASRAAEDHPDGDGRDEPALGQEARGQRRE